MRHHGNASLRTALSVACLLLAAAFPGTHADTSSYASGRVLVKFRPNVVRAQSDSELGMQYKRTAVDSVGVYAITDNSTVAEKVAALSKLPSVFLVEPDYRVTVGRTSNDPLFAQQWHLPQVKATTAWNTETGTGAVRICVVDSGARMDHPDLVANLAGGWNLVPDVQVEGNLPPTAGTASYSNYSDTLGHGTHVAGTIAAAGNNGVGVSGVAWRTKLYICRFIWDDGGGYISDAMTCMSLCRGVSAMVTSNSWGGIDYSSFMYDELSTARDAGQLFINAAGNSAIDMNVTPRYPASYDLDNVLTVAATTTTDTLSTYSNYGTSYVDIGSPGDGILSTTYDGSYGLMWGTSMATPVVSGAASLVLGMAKDCNVTLTYAQVKAYLLSSADVVTALSGKVASSRRLNAAAAVAAVAADYPVSSAPPPASPSVITVPTCGTTAIRGKTAKQSSTWESHVASNAVNGNCKTIAVGDTAACSMTDPTKSNPWWTADMAKTVKFEGVVVKARSDCTSGCYTDLAGAKIMVGKSAWTSSSSQSSFSLCGMVPSKVAKGARLAITCSSTLSGRYLAIFLPKSTTALTLCEVDVVLG